MLIIALAWIYVLGMMALALASQPGGSVIGAVVTLLIGGFGPPAVLLYLWGLRRRRQLKREDLGLEPDRSGEPPAPAVAPEREEP